MRNNQLLLTLYSTSEIIYSFIHLISIPTILVFDNFFLFFSYRTWTNLEIGKWTLVLYTFFFIQNVTIMMIQFVYRAWTISSFGRKYFLKFYEVVIYISVTIIIAPLIYTIPSIILIWNTPGFVPDDLRILKLKLFGNDIIDDFVLLGIRKEINTSFSNFIIAMTLLVFEFTIINSSALYVQYTVNRSTISSQSKKIQKQLLILLILQTFVGTVCSGVSPFICLINLNFDIDLDSIQLLSISNHIVSLCFPDSLLNIPEIFKTIETNDCETDSLVQRIVGLWFFIEYLMVHLLTYCYSISIIGSFNSSNISFSFRTALQLLPIFVVIFLIQIFLQNQIHTNLTPTKPDVITTSTTRCLFSFMVIQGLTLPFSYIQYIFEFNRKNFSTKRLSKHFLKVFVLLLCNYRLHGLSKYAQTKLLTSENFENYSSIANLCLQILLSPALIFSIPELREKIRNLELKEPIATIYKCVINKVLSIDIELLFHSVLILGVLSEIVPK
ncbi:unnamed protein product [Caenorhabditis angaria]|uniref:Uncharacterized protein n=1 Tax=Caenorhabditis angaria TaxID=860376 RepID=A0A9P1IA55_9PELO|nr:unnamed protein product [Caenorhabditis angaria]